jgi:hypothetical protein
MDIHVDIVTTRIIVRPRDMGKEDVVHVRSQNQLLHIPYSISSSFRYTKPL